MKFDGNVLNKDFKAMETSQVDKYLPMEEFIPNWPRDVKLLGNEIQGYYFASKGSLSEEIDLPLLAKLLSHGLYEVEIGFTQDHNSDVEMLENRWLRKFNDK